MLQKAIEALAMSEPCHYTLHSQVLSSSLVSATLTLVGNSVGHLYLCHCHCYHYHHLRVDVVVVEVVEIKGMSVHSHRNHVRTMVRLEAPFFPDPLLQEHIPTQKGHLRHSQYGHLTLTPHLLPQPEEESSSPCADAMSRAVRHVCMHPAQRLK